MPLETHITGKQFGRLTVLHVSSRTLRPNGKVLRINLMCECTCGRFIELGKLRVTQGHTQSCRCLHDEQVTALGKSMKTHGMRWTKVYHAWLSMKDRCYNKKGKHYKNYGAIGIRVCRRWKSSFENFYKDIGDPPSSKHSIDRKNPFGGYYKMNCRWATALIQANNQRRIKKYNFFGELLPIGLAARKYNLRPALVRKRIRVFGWPPEKAVSVPVKKFGH